MQMRNTAVPIQMKVAAFFSAALDPLFIDAPESSITKRVDGNIGELARHKTVPL
jgi:hypothetical protein